MTAASKTEPFGLDVSTEKPMLRPEDIPIAPLFWSLIVEPLEPKQRTAGGLYLAEQSKEVEKIQCTIGRVLRVGSQCFKGKTSSGIVLADDPLVQSLKPGDYVLFARYTGQQIKLRQPVGDDRLVIVLSDTELLGVVSEPERIRFWI